ncbi:hypothetical protein BLNAU_7813 [Blattamonas nauphoetae]|uniref:Uncharacterized protein n=1 Tax=Blattamonas nauphoetae TaxID=2049346 RepID=A0ABQ9Y0K9_9EUKA|nr:hypothetical protein BLNAU_7813 [Blattamonas nauphoetae]
MSENRPPLTDQQIEEIIKPHIHELYEINKLKVSFELEQKEKDEEYYEAETRWVQLCQPILDRDVSEIRIYKEVSKHQQLIIQNQNQAIIHEQREKEALEEKAKHEQREKEALEEKARREQREKEETIEKQKLDQRKQANEDIIKAQSQTIYLIKPVFQQYSPGWKTRLSDHIKDFLLLKDGHILFSKSWLKNERYILSAPLIFRPSYNIILHPVLKFIDRYFATNQRPSHPGGIFYITGDQGIGKTSLMLILMSSLSDRSLNFHYRKGIKGEKNPQDFKHVIGTDGEVIFSEYESGDDRYNLLSIHIHDDSPPPEDIKDNHLYIIFTSPDQNRLPILDQKSSSPSGQKQLLRPSLKKGQICHIFRLPTFSLAEDAVVMVACTPTVPFSLISPEDMELRKEEQKILLFIEKDKVERARQLSKPSIDVATPSQQEFAKTLLKAIAKFEADSSARLNGFSNIFITHLLTGTKGHRFHNSINAFLNDVFTMRTRSISPPDEDATPSTPRRLNWESAIKTLTAKIEKIDKTPEGIHTIQRISQLQDTPESIETLVKDHLGRQTDFDPFSRSLCRTIMEFRDLQTDKDRVLAIIDWLMDRLIDHSEIDKTQTLYIKQLIHALVLSELNEIESKINTERNQTEEPEESEALFNLAMSFTPPPPDLRPDIESLSDTIKNTALTDQRISTDSLTPQLETLKKHFDEPDIVEVANRLNVRDEVEEISKLVGLDDKEKRTRLFDKLIDMITTPPLYNSHKHVLHSLFVLPTADERDADTRLRNSLAYLHAESTEPKPAQLLFIVQELVQYLRFSQTDTNPPSSATSNLGFSKTKMARVACDLLTTIVDPKYETVDARLESVTKEIEVIRDRLSSVLLMDRFFFIARNMNILVTPHSILKGLSERPEEPPANLIVEREQVFRRNMRDTGLSKWVAEATKTLLDLMTTPGIVRKTNNEGSTTSETTLEERVMDTVTTSILANLNKIIDEFFDIQKFRKNKVVEPQWLAIIRSMMNTILFLIDAGMSRKCIMEQCGSLSKLLTVVYTTSNRHLRRVEKSGKPCPDLVKRVAKLEIVPAVRDDDVDEGDDEDSPTRKMQLGERVVDTVTSSILTNVNEIIKEFFTAHKDENDKVDKTKWIAIVRSMMNMILYLIDAGISRHEIMSHCERLGELLDAVYVTHNSHFQRNAEYFIYRAVLDDDEIDTDYVNDLNIFSTYFSAKECRPTNGRDSEGTKPDLNVMSLRTLELPRTLQIGSTSQNRLEQMSIALFARNLLWFLEMEEDLPFDETFYAKQFFTEFMEEWNPGEVVHRSFVDFMNMTGLLSQQNFGLKREEFLERMPNEEAALESGTITLRKMGDSLSVLSPRTFVTLSNDVVQIPPDFLARYHTMDDEHQPFNQFMNKQFGVYLLLWASTELLFEAAEGAASHDSETEKTASSLNVARSSIFGPSPRWLTSTDARTNRGLSFLWDGVLKSEKIKELAEVADSNHSQMMSFNTERILFENALNAAWDDMTALVPVLPDYKKENGPRTHLSAVYSLMGMKTKAAIKRMRSQISFVSVSPFVELITQSEAISAIARMSMPMEYKRFRKHQTAKRIDNLPDCLEMPQVFISFLLGFPTPINLNSVNTSIHNELVHSNEEKHFSSYSPVLETKTKTIGSMPMLAFPKLSNRSVHGSTHPQTLSETKRGETDFFAEDLQDLRGEKLAGLDALIVSRGCDGTHETIFMPIHATKRIARSEMEDGILLIQKLLFQVMCHLEPSERIVALFNSPTKPKRRDCRSQKEATFPSQTGILGFRLVSSFLKFEENALKHMPSILRHRDHPLVTTRTSPHSTMTTRDITDTLLANVGHYPPFSTEFDPWTTSLPPVSNPTDHCLTLPFRWNGLHELIQKSSTDGSTCDANSPQFTEEDKTAKDWFDRMIRVTMQELNRIGVSPADLGEAETERVIAFSSFVLCTAISCRRNELLDSSSVPTTSANDTRFVKLVQSIVGPLDSETLECLLPTVNEQPSPTIDSIRNERFRSLDKLCRHPCIEARLHTVTRVMSNHAMNRIRNPAQEYLSVLQSEKDGGEFRVPARNTLSAILHCGTVLLDNISPLPDIDTSPTLDHVLPLLTSSPLPPNQTAPQLSTHPSHSPIVSEPPPRSKPLRIPLHSFVLAKYGFSDSIPALFKLTQDQVNEEVTDVTPAPLSRWHPRRVVIDPSLFPQHIPQVESLSLFTSFIHRLFDNAFIAVTTSLSTEIADLPLDEPFLLSQIRKIEGVQPNPTLLFMKSGRDFFTSPNASCLNGVDTTTKSLPFPITFSTGYKETDLREEMKQVFEPLTRLLPDNFPTGRPSLVHVDTEGKQKQNKTSSSTKEAEDRARGIVDSVILRMGATSRTPLFVFVVDEDLADHSSLPMSLHSSDGSVGCGMMRQRSLADVLWILFLTRISREVMALPLNTSIGSSDLSNFVIPFLYNSLVDAKLLQRGFYESSVHSVLNTLISQTVNHHLDDPDMIPSVGLELLVSAYPHLTDETQILLLSRLLMACPSHQNGRLRLDVLVNHPSPEIGLVALIR